MRSSAARQSRVGCGCSSHRSCSRCWQSRKHGSGWCGGFFRIGSQPIGYVGRHCTATEAMGDKEASVNTAAARTMAQSHGAMLLRTLQTIDGLGASASNTVVIAGSVELMDIRAKLD